MLIITPRSPLRAVFDFGRGETIRMALTGQHIKFNVSRPGWRPLHIACRLSLKTPSRSTLISKADPAFVKRSSRSFVRYASNQGPENMDKGKMVQPPATPATEDPESAVQEKEDSEDVTESPYTIPNALTLARIIACPFLGYQIVQGDYVWATSLLFACGVSDWLDGYLARHWGGKSVLGSILDPAADKLLMTTLVVTLAWANLLPVPLAVLILGRDVGLSFWAFYVRYTSLPPPRTLSRYFNPSISSAEAKPTQISKLNTALQLILMGVTTVSPLLSLPLAVPLQALQWTVAGTTIWSGLSYVNKAGFKLVPKKGTFRLKKRE